MASLWAPVRDGDPLHLVPHPQSITGRGVVQGQEEHLGTLGQVLHQAGQRRLGAPQALQKPRLIGEGVDDERSPQSAWLVGELPIQSSDRKRVREVPWLRPVRHGGFTRSQHDRVALKLGGRFISNHFRFPHSFGHVSCQNNQEPQHRELQTQRSHVPADGERR